MRPSPLARALPVLALTVALAACRPPPADGMVAITDQPGFFPGHLIVSRGATVEWRNLTADEHMVAATRVPPRGTAFLSDAIRPGETWRHIFLEPGFYRYACALEGAERMAGIIEVR